jgi:hypothetical protein
MVILSHTQKGFSSPSATKLKFKFVHMSHEAPGVLLYPHLHYPSSHLVSSHVKSWKVSTFPTELSSFPASVLIKHFVAFWVFYLCFPCPKMQSSLSPLFLPGEFFILHKPVKITSPTPMRTAGTLLYQPCRGQWLRVLCWCQITWV